MKLMMQPGSALLVMAVLAFLGRYIVGFIPIIGGLLGFILWFLMIFGLIGGVYLLFMARRQPA